MLYLFKLVLPTVWTELSMSPGVPVSKTQPAVTEEVKSSLDSMAEDDLNNCIREYSFYILETMLNSSLK